MLFRRSLWCLKWVQKAGLPLKTTRFIKVYDQKNINYYSFLIFTLPTKTIILCPTVPRTQIQS